jgi:tRNA pseudouridine38-40 synthase
MARYKLIVSYDGTDFAGSQRQARRRTVQEELEKALRPLGWRTGGTDWAGRTDAGVHAKGQVAALDLDWTHSAEALRDALNARLPRDIVVVSANAVEPDFHPRFDAVVRYYRYYVFFAEARDPLRERTAWRVWPRPQIGMLHRVAACFVGRHDFGAFGTASRRGATTVREVRISGWNRGQGGWSYEVAANGFLYRMVRRMVYLQVSIAQGKGSEAGLAHALEQGSSVRELPAGLAPAHGLVLMKVEY